MILSLDHVAIAVSDFDEEIRRFCDDLGLPLSGTEDVVSASSRTAFFPVSDAEHPTQVELVSPLNGEGPLARHLERRGPGLHHLCFRTDDVEGDMARLRGLGYRFTTQTPFDGAHDTRACFIHPQSMGGVLVELAQYPDEPSRA